MDKPPSTMSTNLQGSEDTGPSKEQTREIRAYDDGVDDDASSAHSSTAEADVEKSNFGEEPKRVLSRNKEFPPSIYSEGAEKWLIVSTVALAANLSTISVPIYFPTLGIMADYFHTTVERINLTATMYSIFQGLSPLVWAAMSDAWGRRPIYFACIIIYIASCIGLALAPNYGALFALRCFQAIGGASTVSMSGGVVGDISSRRTRGKLMGISNGIGLLGNCFGPLIGGGIQKQWNSWRAIFWFLVILGGCVLLVMICFLPETNRHVVGTGSRQPKQILSRSPYAAWRSRHKGVPYKIGSPEYENQWTLPPVQVRWFRWAYVFFQPDVLLLLIPTGIHYTTWYMVLTAQSTIQSDDYGFTTLMNGYTYLASGVGTFLGSILSGQLLQWNYKRLAAKSAPDRPNIYNARLQYAIPSSAISVASTLVFGWCYHFHVTFYVPVVMTFFISLATTNLLNTTSALLVDLFPHDSAASQSCNNLSRCLLCAGGLAAVDSMMSSMTIGGTFSFMAGLCALSCLCVVFELRNGPSFVEARMRRTQSRVSTTSETETAKKPSRIAKLKSVCKVAKT